MTFDLELSNKRALVTGGTRGIGAAVVEVLRAAGVTVLATARSVPDRGPAGRSDRSVRRVAGFDTAAAKPHHGGSAPRFVLPRTLHLDN